MSPQRFAVRKEKKPPIQLRQVIFVRGLQEPGADRAENRPLARLSRKRVSEQPDCLHPEPADSPVVEYFEERVLYAVLNDDALQQLCKYHFDGSINLQVRRSAYWQEKIKAQKPSKAAPPLTFRQLIEQAKARRAASARSPSLSYEQASRGEL